MPGEQLTWRFPEPPHPQYPDRPFIVVAGEAIDSPEPWMHEHARALIEAHHRLEELIRTSQHDGDVELARRLMSPELVERRLNQFAALAERGWRIEHPPYDSGVVAIEFQGEPERGASARAYTWLHLRTPRTRSVETNEYTHEVTDEDDLAYTSHWLPVWRLLHDGSWQLVDYGYEYSVLGRERFVERKAPALLPYYLLNANAREQAGLLSEDELLRSLREAE